MTMSKHSSANKGYWGMKFVTYFASACLVFATFAANAEESQTYFGGSVGSSKFSGGGISHSSSGFRIVGGYKPIPILAFEGDAFSLGPLNARGFGVSAVGLFPVDGLDGKFSIYGKIGVAYISTTLSDLERIVLNQAAKQSNTGEVFGLGCNVVVNPNTAIRLSIDRYENAFKFASTGSAATISNYSVTALYNF